MTRATLPLFWTITGIPLFIALLFSVADYSSYKCYCENR
ncbi:hypothetical protein BN938_1001 [Mucinivorans hirudinis]|uniref:Uncharacterized protein n=1 Tax=Mucinivorans hirudinis TaxID=1433126 RepID=A0A060RCF8_9BACT|nr:hypothetical protein BN938_1001 [Mucinivorans hirudinis]